ncbi:MAG: hypothetical protein GC157_00500 [Frankiales bacterium]|nr:hypothetical protein [Frankiales bacterium]
MLDTRARRALAGPLDRVAALLDRPGITPDRLTVLGLLTGVAGAVTAARAAWWIALGLWLASRLLDGLDGPLARRRRAAGTPDDGDAGGFLDITADFVVYGSFVVGVAVGTGASMLPFLLVLLAYYANGAAFLAFSSIAERRGTPIDDGRSLSFLGGLAEGTETVIVHSLWCILPGYAGQIAWVWAAIVGISATQRVIAGHVTLRRPHPPTTAQPDSATGPTPPVGPASRRTAAELAWSTPLEATLLICRGATFATASRIALVVGTVLTLVNQATVIASGDLSAPTLLRVAANYLIPYVVSSIGYLASCRVARDPAMPDV